MLEGSIFSAPLPKREPQPVKITHLKLVAGDTPLYEPAPIVIAPRPAKPAAVPATIDARLLAILDAPLALGETAMAGFARKERELGTAFAQLSILEARALHQRLSNAKPDDALAQKFSRLTVERRNRLLTFLADARRRAAMGR